MHKTLTITFTLSLMAGNSCIHFTQPYAQKEHKTSFPLCAHLQHDSSQLIFFPFLISKVLTTVSNKQDHSFPVLKKIPFLSDFLLFSANELFLLKAELTIAVWQQA